MKQITIKSEKKKEAALCYAMLSPVIIGFCVFTIYSLVWNFKFAFFDYDGVTAIFNGIDNFVRIFTRDINYWKSIINSIIIAYGKLIIEIPLALVMAVLLSKKIKFAGFFRGVYFMPTIIGISVATTIFAKLFATHGGIINDLLISINVIDEPINWFGAKWTSMAIIMIMSVWKNFGTNVLLYMSAVQGISDDYYEAASLDGANERQQFFYITLPLLVKVTRTILLLAITSGVKLMTDVQLLTNGGPAGSTNVVMLYMYKFYFSSDSYPQIGYAAAMGVVTSIILCLLSVLYLKLSKKAEELDY